MALSTKHGLPPGNLFDLVDKPEQIDQAKCKHKIETKTFTQWPDEDFERMTWTCHACGLVRGRC